MNSDMIKSKIRKMSKDSGLDPQELLQAFFLERILDRVSKSNFKEKFILKGGMLIASMIGVVNRTTRDMDATIKSYPVTKEKIIEMINEILLVDIDDGVSFKVQSIKSIREQSEYSGYQSVIVCNFERIEQHVKIDISTGDIITPSEISYTYQSVFGYEDITVMSYNVETIFAEKLESILSKAETTTRMRDYYDVHVLLKLNLNNINIKELSSALNKTAENRGTYEVLDIAKDIYEIISESTVLNNLWEVYSNKYIYTKGLKFEEVLISIKSVLGLLDLLEVDANK